MEFINKKDAVKLIKNNANLLISCFGNYSYPSALLKEIRNSFNENRRPNNLNIITGISPGNLSYDDVGLNLLANNQLVNSIITTHMGMCKEMAEISNELITYTIPLGIYLEMLDAISRNKDFVISKLGLNTYCDPRLEGCRVSKKKGKEIVNVIQIENKECLLYNCFDIDICIAKFDICDKFGNLSFREDSIITDAMDVIMATIAKKGKVIVEVDEVVEEIKKSDIMVPSFLVDYIVIGDKDKEVDIEINLEVKENRLLCAKRAYQEIKDNDIINLGVGMPDSLSNLIINNKKQVNLTIESGICGGIPKIGKHFGTSTNYSSRLSLFNMLKLYQAKVLDIAFLGAAQIDEKGNVNVSKFGKRIIGPGGFIDISMNTKKLVFMTEFLTKDNKYKFRKEIDQITFASINAINDNIEVLYITSICVFKLTKDGIMLIEVNDNIDIEKDILDKMEFRPIIDSRKRVE